MSEGFVSNGIYGDTGESLLPEMSAEALARIALGEKLDEQVLAELKDRRRKAIDPSFAPMAGIDPKNLAEAGWGVVFASDDRTQTDAWKEALKPLLNLRQQQAGERYKEYEKLSGESKTEFLARHGMGPGSVDPAKVPYYLLIVGSPESIPYDFQYQIDVQHAVGRIFFDSTEEYASYAQSVVQAEQGQFKRSPKASFFGVQNPNDKATRLSATQLVQPLADWMAKDKPRWDVQSLIEKEATKAKLSSLLRDANGPALLFTASHGMAFANSDSRQLRHQGALLCQDWPGTSGPISEKCYFSVDDVGSDAQLGGMISFNFACYGAGTPLEDDFAHLNSELSKYIPPHAFVARLPQRLLGHPKGGVLAMVGHVERAWGCSFFWENAGAQRTVFESSLKLLAEGHPVGLALECFNERHAELSTDLIKYMLDVKRGMRPDNDQLARMWTANNDARSYIILGDPAVRLPNSATGETGTSPVRFPVKPIEVQPTKDGSPTGSGTTNFAVGTSSMKGEFVVATSTAPDLQRLEEQKTVVRTKISDGNIETTVAADFVESSELLALHRALVEKAMDGRLDKLKE